MIILRANKEIASVPHSRQWTLASTAIAVEKLREKHTRKKRHAFHTNFSDRSASMQ